MTILGQCKLLLSHLALYATLWNCFHYGVLGIAPREMSWQFNIQQRTIFALQLNQCFGIQLCLVRSYSDDLDGSLSIFGESVKMQ